MIRFHKLASIVKILYKNAPDLHVPLTDESIIDTLIASRGIQDIGGFIDPPHPSGIHITDFGYEKEAERALEILEGVRNKNGTVVVYTDYDADGITGGTVLWETLHLLGFKAMPYVPHRQHEGYGFSKKGIDSVKERYNPSLIISVDHGIAAAEKISYAKSIGIPVIVTDHHLKPEKEPADAEAIFHIPLLSGSGVSYFFSKMLYEAFAKHAKPSNKELLDHNFTTDYLAIASIGTIADLVPLIGPSRSVTKYGLDAFTRMNRVGFNHLFRQAGIEGKRITPYEIGFVIAPRINAIGRLEHAIDALRLLCTTSEDRAAALAAHIGQTNLDRQELVKQAVEEAKKQVEEMLAQGDLPRVLTLVSDTWHEGIIGLIASKIVELHSRPAIVMTKGDGFYKGSARSISALHITQFLRDLKEYLIDAGGHAQAAGFTIDRQQLETFREQVTRKSAAMLKEEDLERVIEADIKIPVYSARTSLVKKLDRLEPFGVGNPQPIFYSEAEVTGAMLFGKTNNHLKFYIRDPGASGPAVELIAFSAAPRIGELAKGRKIQIAYNLEINTWGSRELLRGKAKDWLPM